MNTLFRISIFTFTRCGHTHQPDTSLSLSLSLSLKTIQISEDFRVEECLQGDLKRACEKLSVPLRTAPLSIWLKSIVTTRNWM
ncbi:hypothetical protein L6452_21821 [Arctium lappa]|uniref:Uncharacterized protein n=1 Tax=Arctium lappa TaxID=4217 RepID=A0ACB9AY49_ARCLA|nr:hypothetical protein L6452_21821 [Arctium lappa]